MRRAELTARVSRDILLFDPREGWDTDFCGFSHWLNHVSSSDTHTFITIDVIASSMPAIRNAPRGPADATGSIAELALGGVIISIVIPVFQTVLIEIYGTANTVSDAQTVMGEMQMIFNATMLVLVLLPAISTIVAMTISYLIADWLGVGFYVIMSLTWSLVISGVFTAVIIAVTAIAVFLVAAAFKGVGQRKRRQPPRRYH